MSGAAVGRPGELTPVLETIRNADPIGSGDNPARRRRQLPGRIADLHRMVIGEYT
jgi:hypothetical protein